MPGVRYPVKGDLAAGGHCDLKLPLPGYHVSFQVIRPLPEGADQPACGDLVYSHVGAQLRQLLFVNIALFYNLTGSVSTSDRLFLNHYRAIGGVQFEVEPALNRHGRTRDRITELLFPCKGNSFLRQLGRVSRLIDIPDRFVEVVDVGVLFEPPLPDHVSRAGGLVCGVYLVPETPSCFGWGQPSFTLHLNTLCGWRKWP